MVYFYLFTYYIIGFLFNPALAVHLTHPLKKQSIKTDKEPESKYEEGL
jgi:hypothetical protein